jgi:hypothetical protein
VTQASTQLLVRCVHCCYSNILRCCYCICVHTINSDPSELAILRGFDFAIDNSGIAIDIIKDGLLREQVI